MSYIFDNKNRYQIVFPYTSNKIHVETNIDHGAYKCYQELKEQDVKTYIFMVHDIDSGMIYYFNIPKYKEYDTNTKNLSSHIVNNTNKDININNINNTVPVSTNYENKLHQKKQDEIITRLNHVEYELEILKKMMLRKPKKEEELSCVIL
jgi:hypothetical protein